MAGPNFYRQGGQSKPTHGIGSAAISEKITFEDGSEAHVTPEHAQEIRARATKFIRNARGTGEFRGDKGIQNDYRS